MQLDLNIIVTRPRSVHEHGMARYLDVVEGPEKREG